MRFLSVSEVLFLHKMIVSESGGSVGVRDLGSLQSAVAQPQLSFAGSDLYPTTVQKAAALCFSLVRNHPFVDGNKRVGHAAMETFLLLNGHELSAPVDEQERLMLSLAAGNLSREQFVAWVEEHVGTTGGTA